MNKIDLWIVCGLPGSGKTTYVAKELKNNPNAIAISRDSVRKSLLKEGESYFSHEKQVFSEFVRQVQQGIDEGKVVYADATHRNWTSRHKLIRAVNRPDAKIGVIFMNPTLGTCIDRNAKRTGFAKVPEKAIINMFEELEHPWDDPFVYEELVEVTT